MDPSAELPTSGTFIYDGELDILHPYPALLMAFMVIRRVLIQGDDHPTPRRLARELRKTPAEVLARLEALEAMGAISREADRGKGKPRRCVIQPVATWQPLASAAAARWQDPEFLGRALDPEKGTDRDAG